jgi:ubiquinone/menaquinone biosynthesis C-methylase UbiE
MQRPPNAREEAPFDRDVDSMGSYVYTRGTRLSSALAMARQSRAIYEAASFRGARVIDIGCGDGTATLNLFDDCAPARITAIDPAAKAIAVAESRCGDRNINYQVVSAYSLPYADGSFDIAHLRGALHHMETPETAIAEAARVARTVVVLEPNGYNPILKLIEKTSRYHRAHGERSYPPARIDNWLRQAGLTIARRGYCGLVPYFCPDCAARLLDRCEPWVERLRGVRALACGTYVTVGMHPGPEAEA